MHGPWLDSLTSKSSKDYFENCPVTLRPFGWRRIDLPKGHHRRPPFFLSMQFWARPLGYNCSFSVVATKMQTRHLRCMCLLHSATSGKAEQHAGKARPRYGKANDMQSQDTAKRMRCYRRGGTGGRSPPGRSCKAKGCQRVLDGSWGRLVLRARPQQMQASSVHVISSFSDFGQSRTTCRKGKAKI